MEQLIKENIKDINNKYIVNEEKKNIKYNLILSIETMLLQSYTRNSIISIIYKERGKLFNFTGTIERIDLIYKEVYLQPKKKIHINKIIGIKK